MLKNLTILVLTGALLPACIITDGSTSTDGGTGNSTDSTAGTGTGTDGTDGTGTDGTGTDGTGTDGGTDGSGTSAPTTGEPTGTGTTDQGTTTGTTGQGSEYGMCGWHPDKYYGCAFDGAEPGVSDPEGIDPIGCPEGLNVGDPCTDQDGPVTNIGCCTPTGDNYYCSGDVIVILPCGA